jgi:uncharacterized protein
LRSPFIDQLRGWALLGIVLVNSPFLLISIDGQGPSKAEGLDVVAQAFVQCFATGKFYLVFSFLFGYAVSRFFRVETDLGVARYQRRLWALAVVGAVHACLFFVGDILFSYFILGWILVFVRNRSDKTLVCMAVASSSIAIIILILLALPGGSNDLFGGSFDKVMASGTFWQAAAERLATWPAILVFLGVLNYGFVIACMSAGMLAGRHRFLERRSEFAKEFSKMSRLGVLLGLPLSLVATAFADRSWSIPLTFGCAPLLSAGYVSWFAQISEKVPNFTRIAEASGQMSMTCYLLESIVLSALGCGWGFALFGKIGAFATLALALGVWVVIELLANLWLRRFDQGPMEAVIAKWTKRC